MPRSAVMHGHFYQPPREDPRTDLVPEQPTAAPFHDWNERVTHECYRPIVNARVLGEDGADPETVNCLEWMSFDFGPTLLWWLERHASDVYRAVLESDRASRRRLGHGNALAMPYHHPILPLSSPRDRLTEIRWGIADFQRRFSRMPEGMWLPETAVDDATLDAIAAEGIRFTILAPHQVDPVPADGAPVRYMTRGGREIALFVYDGALSHGIAFGSLLRDGVAWAELMADSDDDAVLRSMATDGETFGHHHKFAEMALAKAITELRKRPGIRLENYASYLAREGVSGEAGIVEPSAWSCAHGVERWRSDCGCRADPGDATSQAWRGPLRDALGWLADGLHEVFQREGQQLFGDPWSVRDAYGGVVGSIDPAAREAFVRERIRAERNVRDGAGATAPQDRGVDPGLLARAVDLLEMERNALRMFTSCAWFFDDIGGIEPRQVLRYAERALELAGPAEQRLRSGFLERLVESESNDPEIGTAADVFRRGAQVTVR